MTEVVKAPVNHATIVIERSYEVTPSRVFQAFADPEARMRWGVPSENVELAYDAADFRIGGLDIGRCGPRGKLIYRIETRYHDIVPGQRIISTEVVSEGQNLLSFALITVELEPAADGTRLVLTDQVAAYGGASMVDGHRAGYEAALDKLRAELAAQAAGT